MTRAAHALLLTVNTRRDGWLHPFLREVLAPPEPGEENRLLEEQNDLSARRQSLVPHLATLEAAISRIADGRELAAEQAKLGALGSERVALEWTVTEARKAIGALGVSVDSEREREEQHRAAARGLAHDVTALDKRIRLLVDERSAHAQERHTLTVREPSFPARMLAAAGVRRRRAIRRLDEGIARIDGETERLRTERTALDARRDEHELRAEALQIDRTLGAAEATLTAQDELIAAARERIAVLEREPKLLSAPLQGQLAALERERARLAIEEERVAGRPVEIDLLRSDAA